MAATYQHRQPEDSVLYRTVQAHVDTFLARTAGDDGGSLPGFVTRELRAYLRCGLLEHGCLHVRCERCGDDMVVAFSCKGRGFCPSCAGRRMTALAARLVGRVIPDVPVRQWVLSLPWSLRYLLAFDAALCREVLATGHGVGEGQGGALTVIQRFGGALNANVHFHSLVLDGVFTRPLAPAAPVFHTLPSPTDEEIAEVLEQVHASRATAVATT